MEFTTQTHFNNLCGLNVDLDCILAFGGKFLQFPRPFEGEGKGEGVNPEGNLNGVYGGVA